MGITNAYGQIKTELDNAGALTKWNLNHIQPHLSAIKKNQIFIEQLIQVNLLVRLWILPEKSRHYFLSTSELTEKNSAINSLLLLADLFFALLSSKYSLESFGVNSVCSCLSTEEFKTFSS